MKNENGKISAELVIVLIIALVIIGVIVYSIANKEKPIEYYIGSASSVTDNCLITSSTKIKKLIYDKKLEELIQNKVTFEKVNIRDRYSDEYFKDKKLALVVCYEDDSQFFEYSINDVTYNESRTEATIKFTNKKESYLGSLTTAWYNYLFVELDDTVTSVNFVEE